MKQARIVFMGTPDFALGCLASLHQQNYPIVGVVTAPDRPAGRGKKLRESPVKQFAAAHDLCVLQPQNLKDPSFLEQLKQLKADIFVVVAFRMLPRQVWQLPPLGTFNLHASLLPDYRGAAPINWAIINGEEKSGVSSFLIDEAIDTGAVLLQESVAIQKTDTAGSLHDKLLEAAKRLIPKTIDGLYNKVLTPIPQEEPIPGKSAPKLYPENTRIHWGRSAEQIVNLIRGLSPFPCAWTTLEEKGKETVRIKIHRASWKAEEHDLAVGTWSVSNKKIEVAIQDGFIQILELQWPGKKQMAAQDLLNGRSFSAESRVL
ncbi:MAG: methionyl-tRNA formyltransferase [Flavobacteriaceae bacterium]